MKTNPFKSDEKVFKLYNNWFRHYIIKELFEVAWAHNWKRGRHYEIKLFEVGKYLATFHDFNQDMETSEIGFNRVVVIEDKESSEEKHPLYYLAYDGLFDENDEDLGYKFRKESTGKIIYVDTRKEKKYVFVNLLKYFESCNLEEELYYAITKLMIENT